MKRRDVLALPGAPSPAGRLRRARSVAWRWHPHRRCGGSYRRHPTYPALGAGLPIAIAQTGDTSSLQPGAVLWCRQLPRRRDRIDVDFTYYCRSAPPKLQHHPARLDRHQLRRQPGRRFNTQPVTGIAGLTGVKVATPNPAYFARMVGSFGSCNKTAWSRGSILTRRARVGPRKPISTRSGRRLAETMASTSPTCSSAPDVMAFRQ